MNRQRAIDITFLLLRVVSGFLFIQVGGMKLFDWFGGAPGGHPPLASEMGIGSVIEVVGGALILLGLATRPAAFILAGEMAVAYFQFHQPKGTWPVQNHGEPAVLFCFIFLFICAHGGGIYSVDEMLKRRKSTSSS